MKKVELVVLTSDRGLAGGFNANINRRALRYLTDNKGKRARSRSPRWAARATSSSAAAACAIRKDYPGVCGKRVLRDGRRHRRKELAERFLKGEVDAVFLMYNEFVSAVTPGADHRRSCCPSRRSRAPEQGRAKRAGRLQVRARARRRCWSSWCRRRWR